MNKSENILQLPITHIETIRKLVPHREPILAIGSLIAYTETTLVASFTIPEDHLFVHNGCFSEAGLLEHMAQCMALHSGYSGALKEEAPREGYIGVIKTADIEMIPKAGKTLLTHIEIVHAVLDMSMVTAEIRVDKKFCAKATLHTILKNSTD